MEKGFRIMKKIWIYHYKDSEKEDLIEALIKKNNVKHVEHLISDYSGDDYTLYYYYLECNNSNKITTDLTKNNIRFTR